MNGGEGRERPDWYPPPLALPEGVEGVVAYLERAAPDLARAAAPLDRATIDATCGRPENADALFAAQEAMGQGAFSEALGLVAPFHERHLHASTVYALAAGALGRFSLFHAGGVALLRMLGNDERPSLYRSVAALASWLPVERPALHVEADAMTLLCDGVGIDVGCGSNKTVPWAIGVDLTPKGEKGEAGCQAGVVSTADVTSAGDDLPMFADGTLDFVVARHNYEHYQDPVAPLVEWARILKPGGRLGIITPDHRWVDSISLDPTHRHAYTPESLARIVGLAPGLSVVWSGDTLRRWSAGVVAVKEGGAPYDYHAARIAREGERLEKAATQREGEGRADVAQECRAEIERIRQEGWS